MDDHHNIAKFFHTKDVVFLDFHFGQVEQAITRIFGVANNIEDEINGCKKA
jgi:hypothetical protein